MALEELIILGLLGGAGWIYWKSQNGKKRPGQEQGPLIPPIPNFRPSGGAVPPGFTRPKGEDSGATKAPSFPDTSPAARKPTTPSNPVSVAPPQTRNGSFAVQPLFDLIRRAEAGAGGYDAYYTGVKIKPPKRLTTMTLREVMDWQQDNIAAGAVSTAAGHFQIISGTLAGLKRSLGLSGNELFNRSLQDRMGIQLMEEVGLRRYENGSMTLRQFGNRLARVWAGLPVLTDQRGHKRSVTRGQSYYAAFAGNKATVSAAQFESALRRMKGA